MSRKAHCLMLGSAVAALSLGASSSALASTTLRWTRSGNAGTSGAVSLSCRSSALCVAVGDGSRVFVSRRPLVRNARWFPSRVDPADRLNAVVCPSASQCVAVDSAGNVVVSTNPAAGRTAWTVRSVDPGHALTTIACPSVSLCVAVDSAGDVVTSTAPTSPSGPWTVLHVDDALANPSCLRYQTTCQSPSLTSISCPSTSFCVAVDDSGQGVQSSDPAGGAGAWTEIKPAGGSYTSVACRSHSLCFAACEMGADSGGAICGQLLPGPYGEGIITRWNPLSSDAGSEQALPGSAGLTAVSCPTSSLCLASDFSGKVYLSVGATRRQAVWRRTLSLSGRQTTNAALATCPTANRCLILASSGAIYVGRVERTST